MRFFMYVDAFPYLFESVFYVFRCVLWKHPSYLFRSFGVDDLPRVSSPGVSTISGRDMFSISQLEIIIEMQKSA